MTKSVVTVHTIKDDWDELLPLAELAYNSSISGDLSVLVSVLDLGWDLKTLLGFISETKVPVQSLKNFTAKQKTFS